MNQKKEHQKIYAAIKGKYGGISKSAIGKFTYPTGAEGANFFKYDASIISGIPNEMLQSFCGVGNPFLCGKIHQGESLLDIGCGSGIDLIVASKYVGATGSCYGIDITTEMVQLAQNNAFSLGLTNIEVREGCAESIPYNDKTFDVIISNGVLNLSPEKETALSEIFRVLTPGGRLQFADIILEGEKARENTLEAWSD